jgi:hypothetical protein
VTTPANIAAQAEAGRLSATSSCSPWATGCRNNSPGACWHASAAPSIVRVLRPGGWLAFPTEECAEGTFALQPSGRYAQSEAYIRKLAYPAFVVREAMPSVLRLGGTTPALGRLYLLQRT